LYNKGRDEANVGIKCRTHSSITSGDLEYSYDDGKTFTSENKYVAHDGKDTSVLKVQVRTKDQKYKVVLEDVDLYWNAPKIDSSKDPFNKGQRGAIVELFGWPYEEIEKECEFLSKAGYMGVKVFPPNEHVMTDEWP